MRRIGVLMTQAADDLEGQSRLLALAQGLQESGWTIGRNVQLDTRWGAGDAERYRRYAAELVALAPDVILVNGPAALAQLQQATRSLRIVFTNVTDPVGAGFIASVTRPGGNGARCAISRCRPTAQKCCGWPARWRRNAESRSALRYTTPC
jgi:putative tryptophan/tyrosine transport system substrate-binding protein